MSLTQKARFDRVHHKHQEDVDELLTCGMVPGTRYLAEFGTRVLPQIVVPGTWYMLQCIVVYSTRTWYWYNHQVLLTKVQYLVPNTEPIKMFFVHTVLLLA